MLNPAIARFDELTEEEQERFRDALGRFVRTYSFLSLIVPFGDTSWSATTCSVGRCSSSSGPMRVRPSTSATVELTICGWSSGGSVSLGDGVGEVRTIYSRRGAPRARSEPLSVIIDRLNERFGTDWTDADRLVFDAAATDLVNDQQMQMTAANNTAENFSLIFGERFQRALLERIDRNEKVVYKFLDDPELSAEVVKIYSTLVQTRAKVAYQEHCPISELLGPDRESQYLEYKSTLRTRADSGEVYKPLETMTIKTVAAFLNSRDGGTLLIGWRRRRSVRPRI